MTHGAERTGRLDFIIRPVEFVEGETEIIGGEIVGHPDKSMRGEEVRFEIASQTGREPEAVYLRSYDGLPLPMDRSTAYWAGETSLAFLAASRWHLPSHPATPAEQPTLH